MSVHNLSELANGLSAIEDWLRESCEARHADDMADVISSALQLVEDLIDIPDGTVLHGAAHADEARLPSLAERPAALRRPGVS